MFYKKDYQKSKTKWQLLFLKKGQLFYKAECGYGQKLSGECRVSVTIKLFKKIGAK